MPKNMLSIQNHDRDSAEMQYIYPVISRRAGGVSVGINLNPNNACNWACIYCQVPNLTRGRAPEIDLDVLRLELTSLLQSILLGDFMQKRVPDGMRVLQDIALSGNGEPTSSRAFQSVLILLEEVLAEFDLLNKINIVVISNGSLVLQKSVQLGLQQLARLNGVLWFKLDRVQPESILCVNQVLQTPAQIQQQLLIASRLCPTWIQTCWFMQDGLLPSTEEVSAYLAFLQDSLRLGLVLEGVLLYGLARPSLQPEAARLQSVPAEWLEDFAAQIRMLGLIVKCTP